MHLGGRRTITSDFLGPKTTSVLAHLSPAGYSCVVKVRKPAALMIRWTWAARMLCRFHTLRSFPTGPYEVKVSLPRTGHTVGYRADE